MYVSMMGRASCPSCQPVSLNGSQTVAAAPQLDGWLQWNRRRYRSRAPHVPQRSCRNRQRSVCVAAVKPFETVDRKRLADKRYKNQLPDVPSPGTHQQTVKESFTLGGLGLHTAEYAHIRVRPAYAGEGRYFVRVPPGTNSHLFEMEDETQDNEEEREEAEVAAQIPDDLRVSLFYEYLRLQEEADYKGTFDDFIDMDTERMLADLEPEEAPPEEVEELIVPRGTDGEVTVSATLEYVEGEGDVLYTTLGSGDHRVQGVEHLLAALETSGIECCRIEIEGGCEVPIIDGSALGWAIEAQAVGVKRAPGREGSNESSRQRKNPVIEEPVTVSGDDGAFVTFVPGPTLNLTTGVDHRGEAQIIGQQWYTWGQPLIGDEETESHPRWLWLPARNYAPSPLALQKQREDGFVKGGTADCTVIAFGPRWYDTTKVRFFDDEPSRHRMVDLVGDLALLATDGGSGLPTGHVMAFKADHKLQLRFVRAMADKIQRPEAQEGST